MMMNTSSLVNALVNNRFLFFDLFFIFLISHAFTADIDNNGFLDQNDFECMALRACIIEGKGDCNPAKLSEFQHIMRSLWDEISDLADFDKVGRISFLFDGDRVLSICTS